MRGTRVFVATTEGPSEIQKIAEEDPEVPSSVVCLNGTSTEAGISRVYNSFVRRPTGIIEKYFGHRVFRVDVSDRISNGSSWQLPLSVAHALFAAGRLAGPRQAAERAVWLTGQVGDPEDDLSVNRVDHVAEKLRQSGRLFASLKAQSVPVTIFVPRANLDDIDDSVRRDSGLALVGAKVIGIDTVDEVLGHLKLPPLKARRGGRKRPRVWRVAALVGLLAILGGGVGAVHFDPDVNAWFRGLFAKADDPIIIPDPKPSIEPAPEPEPEPEPEPALEPATPAVPASEPEPQPAAPTPEPTAEPTAEPEPGPTPEPTSTPEPQPKPEPQPASEPEPTAKPVPDPSQLKLAAVEIRTPSGRTCVGGGANTVESGLGAIADDRFARSAAAGLCRVRYALNNGWNAGVRAWLYAAPVGRERRFDKPTAVVAETTLKPGESFSVEVAMPRWVRTATTHRIVLVAAGTDTDAEILAAIDRDMEVIAQQWEMGRWSALRERSTANGFVARSVLHEIQP